MALSKQQASWAAYLFTLARQQGLPPQRAAEFAAAADAESGLNPNATNKSSGAAGFFQLLSPGYRQRAQALGGVYNPRANALSILNDYKGFWARNPNAAPGAGGSAVERSGEGAGFYASPLRDVTAALGAGAQAPVLGSAPAPSTGGFDRQAFTSLLLNNIGKKNGSADIASGFNALRQQMSAPGPQSPAGGAPSAPGSFTFPVAGQHSYSDTWGAARPDIPGGHHQGTDIFAPRGTPVVAVTDGTVTKMGPSQIGGNRIWINGQWYVAHLSRFANGLKVGSRVHAGQVIGYVGNTGDARSTPPHLHFGWSPDGSQGASWANPYQLLRAADHQ